MAGRVASPLLRHKDFDQPSVFRPENLLHEARRQKDLPEGEIPAICVLDPDGDLVRVGLSLGKLDGGTDRGRVGALLGGLDFDVGP